MPLTLHGIPVVLDRKLPKREIAMNPETWFEILSQIKIFEVRVIQEAEKEARESAA